MLVLTRRPHQSIMIGDDIVVTVLEVKGDQIRLGITAPREVQVYREEVLAALSEANRSAVLTESAAVPPVPRTGASPGPRGGSRGPQPRNRRTGMPAGQPAEDAERHSGQPRSTAETGSSGPAADHTARFRRRVA